MTQIELPDYRLQSPDVAARFDRLRSGPIVLEAKNLGKTFSSPQGEVIALEDINFAVHRREFLCVIRASGCGKSTLIRILAGLETPSEGEVRIDFKSVGFPQLARVMLSKAYFPS